MFIKSYSDSKLILMIKSGDSRVRRNALNYIYENFYNSVRNFVLSNSGAEADSKDVFQESVVVMYENLLLNKYKGKSAIKTYLYSISRHLWLKKLQKRLPFVDIDELRDNRISISGQTGSEITEDARRNIYKAMDQLNPDCKKILIEFYFNNRSMKALQSMFELGSEQAAKNKKMRCLKKIIVIFESLGFTKDRFFNE